MSKLNPSRQAAEDRRVARAAAAVMAVMFDMAPEVFFRGTRGPAHESRARQILWVVLRQALGLKDTPSSHARLGLALGYSADPAGRHRTSVAHALHKIEKECVDDPRVEAFVDECAALVKRLLVVSALAVDALDAAAAVSE